MSAQKTECDFCRFMWLNPQQNWEIQDRVIYMEHLKLKHGWQSEIGT
jgi:hypothetical protein